MKQTNTERLFTFLIIIYRVICLLTSLFFILNTSLKNYYTSIMIVLYLIIGTIILGLCFIFSIKRNLLWVIILIDYFYVLIHPYFSPNIILLEFIWIPEILLSIAVYFPSIQSIFLIILMGIPGSYLLSYGYSNKFIFTINELSFPFYIIIITLYLSITLLSVMLCCYFLLSKKKNKYIKSLEILNSQLNKINRSVSQKIFHIENDSTNEERKRISKEIHDTAGYVFINLIMMLQAASAIFYKEPERAKTLIEDTRDYAERGINEIRHILRNIRNYTSTTISLQNEIYSTGIAFSRATEVEININFGNWPNKYSDKIDSFYILFMQESLTNALKHGHASSISISCWKNENSHTMRITDNGIGATLPIKKGIGITALEDVVSRYNGDIIIRSGNIGFSIQVTIPNEQ